MCQFDHDNKVHITTYEQFLKLHTNIMKIYITDLLSLEGFIKINDKTKNNYILKIWSQYSSYPYKKTLLQWLESQTTNTIELDNRYNISYNFSEIINDICHKCWISIDDILSHDINTSEINFFELTQTN